MIVFDTSAIIDFLRGGNKSKPIVESLEKEKLQKHATAS
jgi:predicted nucleic acid-binding protein